ncbi:MAG TPA: hypothetical protein PLX95_03375 [bacterium]|nr:hypothetical protein [bacterium]
MFTFLGRVLIYIGPVIIWVLMNQKIDRLETKREELRENKTWGKFFWLYGWSIGVKKIGTYIRYVLTGGVMLLVLRWFFILTSTTPK